jgi:EAL domain-containing protein (putative c-di-GMP-specific phosphodiesterase class I)
MLKIDRTFVHGISRNSEDTAIVEAVLTIARSLGLRTIAEGIETPAQLAFLTARGCDSGQGHLFAPPLPPDELTPLLRIRPAFQLPRRNGGPSTLALGA